MQRLIFLFLASTLALLSASALALPRGAISNVSDPITQLRALAGPHNWVELTDGANAFQSALLSPTQANFDAGYLYGPSPTFSCASPTTPCAAVETAINAGSSAAQAQGMYSYSKMAFRTGTSAYAIFSGGGHNPSSGGSADSSILGFDIVAAAQNIVQGGSGGNWVLRVPSATLLATTNPEPAWSSQANGIAPVWWADTNINGQHRIIASHTYSYLDWLGGTKWTNGGSFGTSGDANTTVGSGEIFDDSTGSVTLVTNGSYTQDGWSNAQAPMDVCSDGNLYLWGMNVPPLGLAVWKISNPAGSPTWTKLINTNYEPTTGTESDGLCMPDPSAPATKSLFFVWDGEHNGPANCNGSGSPCNIAYISDLTGTPVENHGLIASVPTLNTPVEAGFTYDSTRGEIAVSDGSQYLYFITPSATPSGWTYVKEANTPGCYPTPGCSLPALYGNSNWSFVRLKYDPVHDVYFMGSQGRVFMRVP